MSDSGHKRQLLADESHVPATPDSLAPEIRYDEESDTLWIGNGKSVPNGEDLFDGCVVFFDTDRRVSGIMFEDARELLLPILSGEYKKQPKGSHGA